MTTTAKSLTPFMLLEYSRNHAPASARRGMRGYVLNLLVGMARLKGRDTGMCFPSVPCLAEMVGRSVRHVRRLLAELEDMDEIQRIPQRRKDGGYSSNLYRLKGLISWAAKNVRGVPDTHGRKTPTGRIITPARGVKPVSGKTQTAPYRPAPAAAAAPVAASGYARTGPGGFQRDPAPSPATSRALSPAQVEEARDRCDPVRWSRLLIEAGMDGITGDDLDMGAARRWRADAIMQGVPLVA